MHTAEQTTSSPTRSTIAATTATDRSRKLPLLALLALATAVFITSLTETLPAGLLPAMSGDLGVSESATGQTVTVYAIGTFLTAIPLTAATAGWRRKRLLLTSMAGFAVANTVTALSSNYVLTMAARAVAGVAAGLAWALLVGYARRMAPARLEGKAIAIAMAGIPVALSLGVPAGTFLGTALGWRVAFLAMTALTVVVLGWIATAVPDYPGRPRGARAPMLRVLKVPGVTPVLFVTTVFVLAHTVLYAYIATFLDRLGMGGSADLVLLAFGVASLVSIWFVGARIHRRLRALTVASTLLVAAAAAVFAVFSDVPALVYVAATLWGLGWGGVPTLLQTAAGQAGGESADAAQALLVTLWNVAMAAGGVVGGLLLDGLGHLSLPWSVLLLLVPVLAVVVGARAHGFPTRRADGAA
ncbi:MFS transporter [Streptomyces mobaraensis NBRC 13819 = DSM 40847]|uniref:MFS transporter n=2 Tax=Streptomyces mobaraensis TaxID=35621 RepID=A0A5N5W5P4_STRMB|nr:MFS transporter [Streptomyces mobaraensis]EMF00375.1 MFS peamease [Streptomyces mobaraensis NBRC 13819 = DSM 40847]KAB7839589.1 MFS transporter [Streptomyces mobaraensis]QTT77367.1 MFS transporter [Streptomyces mobaraensis NBRC 13819 = DSM 40847]